MMLSARRHPFILAKILCMRIGRLFAGGFLLIGLLVVGFILLLRGCLAQYDERYALAPVLYFEKAGKTVLLNLVQYEKATSYSRSGNFVQKSVSTSYILQQHDAVSGIKTAEQKVKHHSDIKYHPVEIMGASEGLAWIFLGEPMAFDPFTLEKKADIAILETRNPLLQGKFPQERKFYLFRNDDKHIYFTASDGTKWQLNTTTLLATVSSQDPEKSPLKTSLEQIEKQQQQNKAAQDSLYAREYPGKLYSQGIINAREYNRLQPVFTARLKTLYQQRDSLQEIFSALRNQASNEQQLQFAVDNLKRNKPSYAQTKVNQDTMAGKWFGLYAAEEWDKLYERVQLQSAHDETARRRLYLSTYISSRNGTHVIEKEKASQPAPAQFFLQGGFLLNKTTAMPVRLVNPGGYLVVYKDKIGSEGKVLLSRMREDGQLSWTFATGLTQWIDWLCTGKQLFIMGADNPELHGDQSNVLWCIDLATGKASKYDYFEDRKPGK
jgi:hypothetical protein